MPRTADANSCLTCRRRRIRCDGRLPICERCEKRDVYCDRSSPLVVKQYLPETGVNLEKSPRELLGESLIAKLFHVYIKDLAPWYDLSDETRVFEREVVERALDSALLFSATIAFAAIYMHRRESFPRAVAESYHDRCVKLLLALSATDDQVSDGTALASTCLLRSYEILAEEEDPNRHLFGASTLVPSIPALADSSLLARGYWNYLREDITYSLFHECPLKVRVDKTVTQPVHDDQYANSMTLLLGRAVNVAFGGIEDDVLPEVLDWGRNFAQKPFAQIRERPFPTIRMSRDCHASALQYHHVARCLLSEEQRPDLAAEICGLAMSSESSPVVVNSYGPIAFAAAWLPSAEEQQTLVDWLKSSEKRTGWSVSFLIRKLRRHWDNTLTPL
jgi:hypothetical protein